LDDVKPKGSLGKNPGKGYFHILHRINGDLVACSMIVILEEYFCTLYFMHDPEFAFLNLGVISVQKEIEFIRFLNDEHGHNIKYYMLGDVTVNCSKLTYKFHYGPGQVLDPYSLKWLDFTPDIHLRMKDIALLSM